MPPRLRGGHVEHRWGLIAGGYLETALQERKEALAGAAPGVERAPPERPWPYANWSRPSVHRS